MEVREYVASDGRSPFAKWFGGLDPIAAAKVTIAVTRLGLGNLSNVKEVGSEVFECRLAFGPGYRIYFGKDGDTLIILLGGGTKKRQHEDIQLAKSRWQEFKMRKTGQR